MIEPFRILRSDTCLKCGSDRSIELYDRNNRALKLTLAIDRGGESRLNTQASYFKCRKCGRTFYIKWRDGKPEPLTVLQVDIFLDKYILLKDKEK